MNPKTILKLSTVIMMDPWVFPHSTRAINQSFGVRVARVAAQMSVTL